MKNIFLLFISFLPALSLAQPGTYQMTPLGSLSLKPINIEVPAKYNAAINNNTKNTTFQLPHGWKLKVFHAGSLSKPRFMAWSPDSVLHVSDMTTGRVWAMPDLDHDGVADTAIIAASNAFGHDVKFFRGDMYIAAEKQVLKYQDLNGDKIYETRSVFIDSILDGATFSAGGGHTTRTIVFDTISQQMFLSIGSACNVCRESGRAEIDVYDLNGKNKRTYATGIRNAVGMTQHPITGALWANNNGSDWQGNDIPPEWTDIVRPNGFYGYPFAYGYQNYFDFQANNDYKGLLPITNADSNLVKSMVHPAGLITAHSAPMGLKFNFGNPGLPEFYRNGMFMVLRGSWNRTPATGAKMIFLSMTDAQDTVFNGVYDFFTGFLSNPNGPTYRGRPVGLETDYFGNIYFTSDAIQPMIGVIMPTAALSESAPAPEGSIRLFPNPGQSSLYIEGDHIQQMEIWDMQGRKIKDISNTQGNRTCQVDTSAWQQGMYLIRINGTQTMRWMKQAGM